LESRPTARTVEACIRDEENGGERREVDARLLPVFAAVEYSDGGDDGAEVEGAEGAGSPASPPE
jgi:hypothetical protein